MSDIAYVPGDASTIARLRAEVAELRDHLRRQQEAFVIGLELAQRTADAEIAGLRATIEKERASMLAYSKRGDSMSDINDILDNIEAGTVRIRWAYDDERKQQEAEQLLDDARTLLGVLNERVAGSSAQLTLDLTASNPGVPKEHA